MTTVDVLLGLIVSLAFVVVVVRHRYTLRLVRGGTEFHLAPADPVAADSKQYRYQARDDEGHQSNGK